MNKIVLSLIVTFNLNYNCYGQINKGLYEVYTFGYGFYEGDSCLIKIRIKYGFKIVDGGCQISKRMRKHNTKIEKLLLKRNGANWEDKY